MVAVWFAALALGAPAGASASSSGEITRALVSPDWTTASIGGEATRSNGCIRPPKGEKPDKEEKEKDPQTPPPDTPPGLCGWIPFATVGPGASQFDCSARRLGSLDENVQLSWVGSELTGIGAATFDLTDFSLQHGSAAPLLCLSAVETVPEGKVCVPEIDCSGYRYVHLTYQLDSALLEVFAAPKQQSAP